MSSPMPPNWSALLATVPQREGYARPVTGLDEIDLIASTARAWFLDAARDHRGVTGPSRPGRLARRSFAWQTAPASGAGPVTFCFIGSSRRHPETVYPFPFARLFVNDKELLTFNVGEHAPFVVTAAGGALAFEPKRYEAPAEIYHRQVGSGGHAGIFRLCLAARFLRPGAPVTLRVELGETAEQVLAWFAVHPRQDALSQTIQTLAEQVVSLQDDLIALKQTVDRLDRQITRIPRADQLESEFLVPVISDRGHYHPPILTALRNGELLLSYREGTDHIGDTGVGVLLRSRDGGRTWSDRTIIAQDPATDHRIVGITELADGRLLCADSLDCSYDQDHNYSFRVPTPTASYRGRPGPLSILESTDTGRTWRPLAGPLFKGIRSLEVTKPILAQRNGRLLMPMYYLPEHLHGRTGDAAQWAFTITVQASTDGGNTWTELYAIARPGLTGEHVLAETGSGRLLLMLRTEPGRWFAPGLEGPFVQIVSDDNGRTWAEPEPVPIPSLASPPHVLALRDGRLLCTFATRKDPAYVGVCLSHDEGRTWDWPHRKILADDLIPFDCGYPCTAELPDGTLVTVYYNNHRHRFYVAEHRYHL